MKIFECQNCGQLLFFDNTVCEKCGHALGYHAARGILTALEADGNGAWRPLAAPEESMRSCANAAYGACNWLVPASAESPFCDACILNRTIPDLGLQENVVLWQRLELAKHRLVYGLQRFGLPIAARAEGYRSGLAFDFLSDAGPSFQESQTVMTGHAEGVITINIAEADEIVRTRNRENMAEPYRTVLGHFRHEVGHHYWERLVRDGPALDACRRLFGDETEDYTEALERHYGNGPPMDWPQRFVSAYASSHPWEDWAETWAHYMHIVDTLETAHAFGLTLKPKAGRDPALAAEADFDPYREPDFDRLMAPWLPLIYAANSLNRSMGQPDLYPFVIPPAVIDKLRFIHGVVQDNVVGDR
ncbi:MAG: hypothetical protein CMM50_00610 [Rhodospirillaceae bacterium]|nr:hypothetical protein [Rhodospirillaceae bacterium]